MIKSANLAKSSLLRSSAGAALAVASISLPHQASAQAVQGTPTVTQGNVTIDRMVPDQDTVRVTGFDAVVDWDPAVDVNGAPLTFLPDGTTLTFEGNPGATGFAILNRINPTSLPAPAEFAGLVNSFLTDATGTQTGPGGFVAFYSPTGILVSGTARFDVQQLLLTTNAVDLLSFPNFATGAGSLQVSGLQSGFGVEIAPGAQISATPENSFFVIAADEIRMGGDVSVNGSTAYIGATDTTFSHSSGLFDIRINRGSTGVSIDHTGSTGGPESSGAGDNHIIYGVTAADPQIGSGVSMLFSGNLGFTPAVSATVADGEIILAANYDVTGRTIDGGTTGQGANSFFNGRGFIPFATADIQIDNANATSNLTAISTHQTTLAVGGTISDFAGDVVLVGRQQAVLSASDDSLITIGGELYVSANVFGPDGGSVPTPVTAGFAGILAEFAGAINVAGETVVTANAYAEVDFSGQFLGSGTGGQAQILADDASITFGSDVTVVADALTEDPTGPYIFAESYTGGAAEFIADNAGDITINAGSLFMSASALGQTLVGAGANVPGDAMGGNVRFGTGPAGGSITIAAGDVLMDAFGSAGDGVSTIFAGATGTGGSINVDALGGVIDINGTLSGIADASGGNVDGGGDGGTADGGSATLNIVSGTLVVGGDLEFDTSATAGNGAIGGFARAGGIALNIADGTLTQTGDVQLLAGAIGGDGAADAGGGANGGTIFVAVEDGSNFQQSTGETRLVVDATGGDSADAGGGTASSGDAFVNVSALSAMNVGSDLIFSGIAIGGNGSGGNGGVGISSSASLRLSLDDSSTLTLPGTLFMDAIGQGGTGNTGGLGQGGSAGFSISNDSTLDAGGIAIVSTGTGGDGSNDGGEGNGGLISNDVDSATLIVSGAQSYDATGTGGDGSFGNGGNGTGGLAGLRNSGGLIDSGTSAVTLNASGIGGEAGGTSGTGGDGTGSTAELITSAGGLTVLSSVNAITDGTGGDSAGSSGGTGTGGQSTLASLLDSAVTTINNDVQLSAIGTGGSILSFGGIGGDAVGGSTTATAQSAATLNVTGAISGNSNAVGGAGQIGGLATAGTAAIGGIDASMSAGGASLSADAIGGEGGEGGDAQGGDTFIGGSNIAITFDGNAVLSATAIGGEDFGSSGANAPAGGAGQGGSAAIQLDAGGSFVLTNGGASLDTTGTGGDSFDGPGGAGTGGDTTLEVLTGSAIDIEQDASLIADGVGGQSTGGFAGGDANGNGVIINADGASSAVIIGGQSTLSANATATEGGSSNGGSLEIFVSNNADVQLTGASAMNATAIGGDGGGTLAGGNATGGGALITVDTATLTFGDALSIALEAVGGAGDIGGDAQGGSTAIDIADGQFDVGGALGANGQARGGDAGTGGQGTGGDATLTVTNSTATFADEIVFEVDGRGGSAGVSTAPLIGGSGIGGDAVITIANSDFLVDLTNGRVVLSAEGQGVGSADGTGGDGIAGLAQVDVTNSTATFGTELNLFTLAVSGGSNTADGGIAQAGNNLLNLLDSDLTVGAIVFENTATGNGAAPGGDALGGSQSIALDGSTLTSGDLTMFGGVVTRADGAVAQGSTHSITLTNGSDASFASTYIESAATSDGSASDNTSGSISIGTGGGADSTLSFTDLELFLDAENGATNRAGPFDIIADNGTISADSIIISSLGTAPPSDPGFISANAGDIVIADALAVQVTGDLIVSYGNGGSIIGGAAVNDLTASFDLNVDGVLVLGGDDPARDGIAAVTGNFASLDIDIDPTARIFLSELTLQSLNTGEQGVIGGTTEGSGYSLLSDELLNIGADALTIIMPVQTAGGPDVVIDDAFFSGSAGGGISSLTVDSAGSIEIIGDLALTDAGSTDSLSLFAGTFISLIVPDASVSVNAGSTDLGGLLVIDAGDQVIATTPATRDLIFADASDPGIAAALIDSTGFNDEVFFSADRVEIGGDLGVFTQNTGQNDIFAGILVGPGGLLITHGPDPQATIPVIAFGAQDNGGVLSTNSDFFALAEFDTDRAETYNADATFNNCVIVTSACPVDPVDPVIPGEPVNNKVLIEEPLIPITPVEPGGTTDAFFGFEFPSLFNAPLIIEDPVVRDPVTSGGDSALYALDGDDASDENEGEDN